MDTHIDSVGARIHLPADQVGQVVHLGNVSPCPMTPSGSGSGVGSTASNPDSKPKKKSKDSNPDPVLAPSDTTDQEATNPDTNAADEKTQSTLEAYGPEMWEFLQRRDGRGTTRALNIFKVGGEARE